MLYLFWGITFLAGVGLIVWGAESFAEHLGAASVRLGVSSFALALLLAGAEPEELATSVAASLKGAPAVVFGDVIGANVTVCLVALGVGAIVAPLPFRRAVMRYALLGLPLGALCAALSWNGRVERIEGAVLVLAYLAYVAIIWIAERRPPSLGEVKEIEEAREKAAEGIPDRIGRDLILLLSGVLAMVVGATLLVEAIQRVAGAEHLQARLSLTLVGFATGFELVVLAWSAARRGASEAVVAAVVGSFAYNVTMTLGAGALVRPLGIADAAALHWPWLAMIGALALVTAFAARGGELRWPAGIVLLALYPVFVLAVFLI